MRFKCAALSAILCVLSASVAHAATTHVFDLRISGDPLVGETDNSITIASDVDGTTLTGVFTGGFIQDLAVDGENVITSGSFSNNVDVERHNNGLGVCRAGADGCSSSWGGSLEPHTVDGATEGVSDFVEMAFYVDGDTLVDVTLSSLVFGWIGEWDYRNSGSMLGVDGTSGAFELILDTLDGEGQAGIGLGDLVALMDEVDVNLSTDLSRGIFDLTDFDLIDSIFGVSAGDGGSWKLLAVTVDYTPVLPPEIPLPAPLWLLLGGLGGMAMLKRRKAA